MNRRLSQTRGLPRSAGPQRKPLLAATLSAALIACAGVATAQSPAPSMAQIEADLAGPVQILLDNGNRQTGRVTAWDGESLRLEVELGGGSAEMTFTSDAIEDISFPGNDYLPMLNSWTEDPSRVEEALALFRAFYQQRGAYLQFMDAGELNLFVRYARYALDQDKPLRAVAMIEVLRPYIEEEALLKSLDDAVLLGFFLGGMREQAEEQARSWIEAAEPAGGSALGWRILAEIHFQEERYEDALWTALYPVAFANQIPMAHLDTCYAFAIAAAEATRQPELALRLASDMAGRALSWPEDIEVLAVVRPEWLDPGPGEAGDATGEAETAALPPIQTPSPLDPEASLPTRIRQPTPSETPSNQAN